MEETKKKGGNKKTVALTVEQYEEIIKTMKEGFTGFKPCDRTATALVLEANLGMRISDILQLTPSSFIKDGERWRLDIVEQKTGKERNFTVPKEVYLYIKEYWLNLGIKENELIFPISVRGIQKSLKKVCDFLDYDNISTHSFRKFYATNIYTKNGYNIVLVQQLLQHSSPAITQRYLGIGSKELEKAIQDNLNLI